MAYNARHPNHLKGTSMYRKELFNFNTNFSHHASVRHQQNERLHRHQRRVAKLFENSLATIIESQLEQGNRYTSISRPVASSSQSFTPQHQILRETPYIVNVKTRPLIKELPTASRRECSNTLETLVPIPIPAKIASPPLIPYTPKWFLATGSISQSTYDNYIDKSTNIQNSGAWYDTAVPYFINFFQPTDHPVDSRLKKCKAYLSDVQNLLNLHNSVLQTKRLKLSLDFLPVPANALGP
ncbi:hypothetical protein C1645_842814 [Glomus cerebriforme]|uniref:DUF8211 domain-containing protein n=1 Tax=Glomus cerebriforme TaxID=658196 RepID=A0A397S8L3_9GLOM|nr:hypothetical protein C1645_842814 [Glomus cerebriforme]